MLSSAWNSNDQLTRFNTNLTKEVNLRGHMAEGKKKVGYITRAIVYHISFLVFQFLYHLNFPQNFK
jgi:hypothetical protein